MEESILIGKVYMDCPLCDKKHEVEERKRLTSITIKGDKVFYEERFFCCVNVDEEENEFESGAMANENLMNARNAYRVLHGLLTSEEIVGIRESYGLSQVDLARLLGWGEATISRYESKAIQDEAYDTMLRMIKDNPLVALELLKKNEDKFSETKRKYIRSKIVDKLDSYGKEYLTRQALEAEYANFDKLMKMLWYADALSFKRRGVSMTGMVYRHESMGALPIGHYSLMNLENLNVREEESNNYDLMLHVYPSEGMDYSILTDEDRTILDDVIKKFKNYKAKDIIEYMHREIAYTKTKAGEIIPFSLAKEIRNF